MEAKCMYSDGVVIQPEANGDEFHMCTFVKQKILELLTLNKLTIEDARAHRQFPIGADIINGVSLCQKKGWCNIRRVGPSNKT